MEVISTPAAMQEWSRQVRRAARLCLVPTMGALHAGHLRLIEVAAGYGPVAVSIFVNPLQFNRPDDFERYPRPVDDDVAVCRARGVAALYAPGAAAMYPPGFETTVVPGAIASPMEGAARPGHFVGVTTVVAKLFHAVVPDVAVFGRKDYQQLAVIRRMVADLDWGIEIVGVDTVREPDGLAMSSRNRRLPAAARRAARCVPAALDAVRSAAAAGERDSSRLVAAGTALVAAEPSARLEYLQIADADDLQAIDRLDRAAVAAIAVWFGDVRLIDNVPLAP